MAALLHVSNFGMLIFMHVSKHTSTDVHGECVNYMSDQLWAIPCMTTAVEDLAGGTSMLSSCKYLPIIDSKRTDYDV